MNKTTCWDVLTSVSTNKHINSELNGPHTLVACSMRVLSDEVRSRWFQYTHVYQNTNACIHLFKHVYIDVVKKKYILLEQKTKYARSHMFIGKKKRYGTSTCSWKMHSAIVYESISLSREKAWLDELGRKTLLLIIGIFPGWPKFRIEFLHRTNAFHFTCNCLVHIVKLNVVCQWELTLNAVLYWSGASWKLYYAYIWIYESYAIVRRCVPSQSDKYYYKSSSSLSRLVLLLVC